ncbi:large ribosomal subunit protein mL42-like [Arvicanthis niloticus]|uniref:39S ribosomal protein L42, mitochondrial-like n=1 Tax=Arvicanthis niloticus TaxID=61156 RepID=UPI001485F7CC|nr:39S ribosomal protein L42, mitochondrial-like [Arvicanthis niloticus]
MAMPPNNATSYGLLRAIFIQTVTVRLHQYTQCPSIPDFQIITMAVKWAISNRTIWKHLLPIHNEALLIACHKSTYSSLSDDYNCKVDLTLSSEGRTIVCYHLSVDIPYEHSKPILSNISSA